MLRRFEAFQTIWKFQSQDTSACIRGAIGLGDLASNTVSAVGRTKSVASLSLYHEAVMMHRAVENDSVKMIYWQT